MRDGQKLWVARLTREAVAAFAQNHSLALRIGADDPGEVGNVPWTRSYRPRHLDFCRLARSTAAALIYVHVTVIVRLLHLRSDRTSLEQQQTGQKDDDKAIPSGEFHKSPSPVLVNTVSEPPRLDEPHHRG
jgi:hypothetical protein